jgi:L-asparagine oxygenase
VSLDWHTEDAFHPLRCDYLTLLCLRNLDLVPTTFASVDCVDIDPAWLSVLREPRFLIRPDDEHLRQAKGLPAEHQAAIGAMREQPAPCPVLFGRASSPYLRIDPYFMSAQPGDEVAPRALAHVTERLDAGLGDVALTPGELLIIDNYKAVHGRRPYQPRFDGRDRWLKKAIVSRDLRKSRAASDRIDSRVSA